MAAQPDIATPLADRRFCAHGGDLLDRTYRADLINYFAAHPDIAPLIGGPLDFTNAIRDTNVYLFGEHGGLLFNWCAPRVYEAHIMLTKAGRGAWGIAATNEALAKLGADMVWARIVPGNRPLAQHAVRCGFRRVELKTLYDLGEAKAYFIYEWRA